MPWMRFGFDTKDTMPVKHWMKIPRAIRNTPDYIIMSDSFYFLEVKQCLFFGRQKKKRDKAQDSDTYVHICMSGTKHVFRIRTTI